MDGAQIGQILAMVGAAIGFTDISKKLLLVLGGIRISPAVKRAISVLTGVVLAWSAGVEIGDVLPGGAATDGAIYGAIGTAVIALINAGKKKPGQE